MHVLIADDDPVYRNLLDDLLGQWCGFDVTCACDGQEAWEAIERDPTVQLAILDWMMPGMDGYQICQRLKSDDATADVYTILVTGSQLKDEVIKVLVAGADDYIIKPFDPLDLRIRVRAAMRIITLRAEVAELRKALPEDVADEALNRARRHSQVLG